MLGRVLDAIATRLTPRLAPIVEQLLEQQDAARRKEVRELVREMTDSLERASRIFARQARRRQRDEEGPVDETPEPESNLRATSLGQPAHNKDELRRQYAHLLAPRTRHG